jgi:hypothetical protein
MVGVSLACSQLQVRRVFSSGATGRERIGQEEGRAMELADKGITAAVTLLAVMLGGWLSTRTQDRHWRRESERQWRDVRLTAYNEFLTAFRQYIAFILEPTSTILVAPHPRQPGELMPFFDKEGTPYKEKFEATKTAVRLVSSSAATLDAQGRLVVRARRIAAARASQQVSEIPSEEFQGLWYSEMEFIVAARQELGLTVLQAPGSDPLQHAVAEAAP